MSLAMVVVLGLAGAGCAGPNAASPSAGNPSAFSDEPQKLIVTPDSVLTGKVVLVNDAAHHVVLDFPIGQVPLPGTRFGLYRRGLKVGEVEITRWQNEEMAVADIVEGEAAKGDEARGH